MPQPTPTKRRLPPLKYTDSSKRAKFSNLSLIRAAHQRTNESPPSLGFWAGGSPAEQLPPYLTGKYISRNTTQVVLRTFYSKGAEILTGVLQEGTSIEKAVKSRHWKRSLSGKPYQSEQEARTLARIIHLT